jgi:hypothetical protein
MATPAGGVRVASVTVRSSWQKHVLTFLMVFSPGPIVMEPDDDAGAVCSGNSCEGKKQ